VATSYNQIAGQSVERLAALSDGIFGVAMALLLRESHVLAKELIHGEGDLRDALAALAPQFFVYLMSFPTPGISTRTGASRPSLWSNFTTRLRPRYERGQHGEEA
jgi:hypothetical protein